MIETDVIAYLKSDATLDTLLGATGADSKIMPDQMKHGATEPFILFTTNAIGGVEENLLEVSMSFNCIDTSYNTAKSIRDRLQYLLDQQNAIQNVITSTEYYIYWSKMVGGTIFKDSDLDLFHCVAIFDFKYRKYYGELLGTTTVQHADIINKVLPIPIFGNFVDEFIVLKDFYFPADVTILKIGIHADNAPTGANATLDILKNDVEQSRIATLNDGARGQTTNIADISFLTTDKFELKWKTIGTTNPGEGGIIMVYYQ